MVINNSEGKRTTPSVVAFIDGGERKVGKPPSAKPSPILRRRSPASSASWDQASVKSRKSCGSVAYKVVKGDNNTPRVQIDDRQYMLSGKSPATLQK